MRTSYAQGHPQRRAPRRLPGDPQGRPLPRVPPRRAQRGRRPLRPARRAGRDLERHAVLLAAVGRGGPGSCSCTTSTPTCGRWCCRRQPELARAATRSRRKVAPPLYRRSRDGHPVAVVEARDARDRVPTDRVDGGPTRRRPPLPPGGERSAHPAAWSRVGRLVPVKRFDRLIRAVAAARRPRTRRCASLIVGTGPERPRLEALDRRARRRAAASASPAASPTTSWSTSTAGPGPSPAPRSARAGA